MSSKKTGSVEIEEMHCTKDEYKETERECQKILAWVRNHQNQGAERCRNATGGLVPPLFKERINRLIRQGRLVARRVDGSTVKHFENRGGWMTRNGVLLSTPDWKSEERRQSKGNLPPVKTYRIEERKTA